MSAACGCAVTACMRAVGSSWLQDAALGEIRLQLLAWVSAQGRRGPDHIPLGCQRGPDHTPLCCGCRRTELISERNDELHRVAAALEDAKQQLENSGSNLTDASPLARLKAAMSSLREELKGMELRIGVVAHNLMSLSLADKQLSLQDAARRRVKDVTTAKSGALA